MPDPLADFTKRSEQYKAHMAALDKASAEAKYIAAIHSIWTGITVIGGLLLLWNHPTVRWGIGTLVSLFVIRWVGNIVINVKHTKPTLARIAREYPVPPKADD